GSRRRCRSTAGCGNSRATAAGKRSRSWSGRSTSRKRGGWPRPPWRNRAFGAIRKRPWEPWPVLPPDREDARKPCATSGGWPVGENHGTAERRSLACWAIGNAPFGTSRKPERVVLSIGWPVPGTSTTIRVSPRCAIILHTSGSLGRAADTGRLDATPAPAIPRLEAGQELLAAPFIEE